MCKYINFVMHIDSPWYTWMVVRRYYTFIQYCSNCSFSHFTSPCCPDSSASSESSEDKTKKRGSKSTKRSTSYSEVTVRDVIQRLTRKNLHSGIKNMLTEHRTDLLCDDWGLINEECRDDILGDLEANKKTKAANRLIDYFRNTHSGKELLLFCDFLTTEAKDAGRNSQLLELAKAIKEAVYDASPGPSGML